jgi:hypothetical protein
VPPAGIVEADFTAESADLGLDADDDGEVAAVDQRIACVLERREHRGRLVQVVADLLRRLGLAHRHESSLAAAACPTAALSRFELVRRHPRASVP